MTSNTPTRSRRDRRSDGSQSFKCDNCEVVFVTKAELVLHNNKPKCKHHSCEKCKKNYANERTLKSHNCEGLNSGDAGSGSATNVDQDIKVIKLDRNKLNHQVSCQSLIQKCITTGSTDLRFQKMFNNFSL